METMKVTRAQVQIPEHRGGTTAQFTDTDIARLPQLQSHTHICTLMHEECITTTGKWVRKIMCVCVRERERVEKEYLSVNSIFS